MTIRTIKKSGLSKVDEAKKKRQNENTKIMIAAIEKARKGPAPKLEKTAKKG
jgi:hypothetical protein